VLIGDRVRLRAPERSDLPSFLRWVNDPEVTEHLLVYLPFSMEDEERWYDSLLTREGKVLLEDKKRILDNVANLITDEFQKEDQLDQEVREILGKHMEKIRKENIEYQTMFKMIKTKLAKERNIVL